MPKIPQSTIDRIRDQSDIVDVISEEVSLKRKGVNYFGRCPFHDEKTPSFSVSPSKQIYHCFGCGNGGNVFTFLMEFQKFKCYLSGIEFKYDKEKQKFIDVNGKAPPIDHDHSTMNIRGSMKIDVMKYTMKQLGKKRN